MENGEETEGVEGEDYRWTKGEGELEFLGTPRVGDELGKMVQRAPWNGCERRRDREKKGKEKEKKEAAELPHNGSM